MTNQNIKPYTTEEIFDLLGEYHHYLCNSVPPKAGKCDCSTDFIRRHIDALRAENERCSSFAQVREWIIDDLWNDMCGRKGFDANGLDEALIQEWRDEWRYLIDKRFNDWELSK